MRKLLASIAMVLGAALLAGCQDDATVASHNLSKAADNFEIARRVVFMNGITGGYILTVEGLCSITDQKHQLEVTCKMDNGKYIKHFLGLSDNVTYFAEQLAAQDVSVYHYRVTFKPDVILPDVNIRSRLTESDDNIRID